MREGAGPCHGLYGLHRNRSHADLAGKARHWAPPALDGAHEDGEAEAGEWSAAQAGVPVTHTTPKRFDSAKHLGEG